MSKNDIKVAFVIGAPFPTNKAYGVTSRETVIELLNNSLQTKVFCLPGNYSDVDFKKIIKFVSFFAKNKISQLLIKFGSIGSTKLNSICWKIGLWQIIKKNLQTIEEFDPDLIWVRDPMIAYLYLKKLETPTIILEVHDGSGSFFYRKLLRKTSRISFFPINKKNKDFLARLNPKVKSSIAPMGIRSENLATEYECLKYISSLKLKKYKNIKIGYVGKIAPGGYSKGTEDLIKFAEYAQLKNLDLSVTLVGLTDSDFANLQNARNNILIKEKYLYLKGHVNHSQALRAMKDFDVLVLPAYSSENYVGMPLKLLEYLSSGRITIVADSLLYKEHFVKNFEPFYYIPGDSSSLETALNSAFQHQNLSRYLLDGVKFASEYTWKKRTLNIIAISQLRNRELC